MQLKKTKYTILGSEVEEAEDAAVSLLKQDKGTSPAAENEEGEEELVFSIPQIPTPTPNVDELKVDEIVKEILGHSDEDEDDLDENDIEFIPPRENDLETTYPGEELPSEYSQVRDATIVSYFMPLIHVPKKKKSP